MITFKQYLAESRSAPLYHATDIEGMLGILRDNQIMTGSAEQPVSHLTVNKNAVGTKKGISLTRSLRFAKSWGDAVFVIDQQKLSHNFKIVPFQFKTIFPGGHTRKMDRTGYANEYEEFVVTNRPIPVNKYVTKVLIKSAKYNQLLEDRPNLMAALESIYGKGFFEAY